MSHEADRKQRQMLTEGVKLSGAADSGGDWLRMTLWRSPVRRVPKVQGRSYQAANLSGKRTERITGKPPRSREVVRISVLSYIIIESLAAADSRFIIILSYHKFLKGMEKTNGRLHFRCHKDQRRR